MHDIRQINESIHWVGANDRRISLFENVFPVPSGMSYNSYVVLDEKITLLDTVAKEIGARFFENLEYILNGKQLDYIIINHMEPDHCSMVAEVVQKYPQVKLVCNAKTSEMLKQFFNFDVDTRINLVKEGDTLNTGKHTFTFYMAPMVHWPEVMVTYEKETKTLFSADAFGTFGALGGSIFAHDVNFEQEWLCDARRYYTNIVGKYGTQVLSLLKKASTLDIEILCPLHGPVWTKKINWFIDKYLHWASYTPEEKGVLIVYGSVYGNTENAVEILANKLTQKGIRNIKLYDVSAFHKSYILADAFRYSHIVFASITYNAGIFSNMQTLLHELCEHNLQNRTIALIENGSWAPTSKGLMSAILSKMKNTTILNESLSIKSSVKEEQLVQLDNMVKSIADSMLGKDTDENTNNNDEQSINPKAMFSIPYGLFLLVTNDGNKDNACVVNTVMQVTDTPKRIMVCVDKNNYTHDTLMSTKIFNALVLTQSTKFKTIQRFGFNCGRDTNKFESISEVRTPNNLRSLDEEVNTVISGKVISHEEFGTHTVFVADVTYAQTLNEEPSLTYNYYLNNIKPKPVVSENKKGYVCKICGWVHEGDTLPSDIICPLCKHGADAFEPLGKN